jgi:hypothetical protein
MIKKYEHIQKSLDELREIGVPRGENTGFKKLDELYSLKQGSFTFILAPPHHGKSEFCFELVLNQAQKYGKKSLIYSPETGSVEDIYSELIHKITGSPFYKSISNHVDDKRYYEAINYIDNYFSIVDGDEKGYSFKDLTELTTDEKIILSDPYNELVHDMTEFGTRQDLYIEKLCSDIRRYCKKNKKHCLQTLHPAHQQIVVEKGLRYYPMPMAREAAGGQALLRKAMTWINLWRPPIGLNDEDGQPYRETEVVVNIEKAKPKGVSTRGTTRLFFDWKRNRYFEEGEYKDLYAFEHEKQTKGTDFREPLVPRKVKEEDEAPF